MDLHALILPDTKAICDYSESAVSVRFDFAKCMKLGNEFSYLNLGIGGYIGSGPKWTGTVGSVGTSGDASTGLESCVEKKIK